MIETDFLVIGSGISGLWYAYRVSSAGRALVVTKKEDTESNTNYAQGGIAAAVDKDDSPLIHMEDTLKAGNGLCNRQAVEKIVYEGPLLIKKLEEIGVEFSKNNGEFNLGKEGGHSRRRIIHAKDRTGNVVEKVLLKRVKSEGVQIMENHFTVALLCDDECQGAVVVDRRNLKMKLIKAKIVFLASGGLCWIYEHTTNPPIATGDGIAMAYRIGAEIANLEFIQFHPTALYGYRINGRAFLISEAVRGEGALLKTINGERFMEKYHPDKEMAPRDAVARAIYTEIKKRRENYVLLDMSPIGKERIKERFPYIYNTCLLFGIDVTEMPVPVTPAAHYSVGGIKTGLFGETSIPYLLSAGETTCTGVHGSNRLASNSLLEALVFSNSAAEHSLKIIKEKGNKTINFKEEKYRVVEIKDTSILDYYVLMLKREMWRGAGIVRNTQSLEKSIERVKRMAKEVDSIYPSYIINPRLEEVRNMFTVSQLILISALLRKESRGLHYNEDYPYKSKEYEKDTIIKKEWIKNKIFS